MNEEIEECAEDNSFLQKLSLFKEEHLKLKNLRIELLEENRTLKDKVQLLENKLESERKDNSVDTIIRQQQTIIEYLRNRGDYRELKTDRDNLKKKVESLENKIKIDKTSHEQEIQNIMEKNANQINDLAKEKLDQMQKKCDELSRKNEELGIALESMDVETGGVIARLDMEHKEQLFRFNSENQLLLEKLKNQEEIYKQKMNNLETDNKNKSEFIKKLLQDKNQQRSAYQPLDEAFRPNRIIHKRKLANSSSEGDNFSPFLTEEDEIFDE